MWQCRSIENAISHRITIPQSETLWLIIMFIEIFEIGADGMTVSISKYTTVACLIVAVVSLCRAESDCRHSRNMV